MNPLFYFRQVRGMLIISCFLTGLYSTAQQTPVSFRHYGVSDGLSDNTIRSIYFDSQGFLWVGTNEGLNRFDGEEFYTYKKGQPGEKFSICGNVISDVVEDSHSDLWIATRDGGICHMNRITGEVFHPILYNDSSKFEVSYVHQVKFGNDSLLYVCSDKGLFVSDRTYTTFHLTGKNRLGAYYDVLETPRGMIVAQINMGVALLDADTIRSLTKSQSTSMVGHLFSSFFKDSGGNIWGGCWDHFIHHYDAVNSKLVSYDFMSSGTEDYINEEIFCITEARKGWLWAGMKSGTIWTFDSSDKTGAPLIMSTQESERLNGSRIFCMTTDPQGRTWVGTDAGLHVYNPFNSKFDVNWIASTRGAVNDFKRTGDTLWIATLEGMYITSGNKTTNAPPFELLQKEAHAIHVRQNGELWVGTNSSPQKFDPIHQEFRIPWVNTNSIDGSIWGATRIHDIEFYTFFGIEYMLYTAYGHGTMLLDVVDKKWAFGNVHIDRGIDNLTRGTFVDSKGRLWFLGSIQGLGVFKNLTSIKKPISSLQWNRDSVTFVEYNCEGFPQTGISRFIAGMLEDTTGNFYVATQGSGLLYFEPEKDTLWFTPIPNSPLSVKSLARDNFGVLWMNASGGLYAYYPDKKEWKRYDELDGIPSAGLSSGILSDADSTMLVGGNGFYLRFHPSMTITNKELPKTRITHLEVMSEFSDSLLSANDVVFPFSQNFLTFHFTALCFNNAENCTFHYKLDGLDNEWINNGTQNFVRYNKLPFGNYTFRVKAINSSGVIDQNEAVFHFTIQAPFYLQWWFILLMFLLISTLLFAFAKNRIAQRRRLESMRNKIARDLHDDVGSALGSISFFSETAKKALQQNNPEGTAMVLEKMGHTSREMIENMHDIVWAVNPKNDGFDHVVERMRIHAANLASSNNLVLSFQCDAGLDQLKLTMTERKNLFLIFKEALYNSVKYSGCDSISINITSHPPADLRQKGRHTRVCLTIEDNGSGFDVEKRTGKGNGLVNMSARAAEMAAQLHINSQMPGGTSIVLCLP